MNISALSYANPGAQVTRRREVIERAIRAVLDSGRYILGPEHDRFEVELANFLNAGFVVGTASGTDSLYLALKALDVGCGDEVIVPSHTAPATVSAIRQAGAHPVFVDVDEPSYTTSPALVANEIGDRTKAVIIVHLYGYPCDVEPFRSLCAEHGLGLIEDCAQAAGARVNGRAVGTFGDLGCFSFFPTKNLGALGDGGAVATNNARLAGKVRQMRCYGWSDGRICTMDGMNSRLDEMQAAILRAKLPYLEGDNERRRELARLYEHGLQGCPVRLPVAGPAREHVYHLYVISTEHRDKLMLHLREDGIATGIHYCVPTHLHPAFVRFCAHGLPATESLVNRILSLPMYPDLDDREVSRVCDSIRRFFRDSEHS